MRALENRSIFSGGRHDREKQINEHRERLKSIKNVVDTSKPSTMETRCTSPSKKIITKQVARERIVKDNLLLARKIFNIMEGNSDITDKINDSRHIDNHPGTMNFRQRLSEAQRIHERNMLLASRLDTVQPYYKIADLTIVKPVKKKIVHKSHNSKKSKFARELGLVLKADRVGNAGDMTHRSAGSADYFGAYKFSPVGDGPAHSQSARKPEYHAEGSEPESRSENQRTRPSNVLLEYTKIQDGRVLDVAVLKEPFRDRYAIFGIDVDDGQRYELRLTSDEVSSILDGDMLVTSVDNVEVWMALLNKVILQKVGYFARLPFSAEEVDQINTKESGNNSPPSGGKLRKPLNVQTDEEADTEEYGEEVASHYTLDHRAVQVVTTPPMSPATAAAVNAATGKTLVPVAPTASRPSDRPSSRAASGGAVTSAAGAVRGRHQKSSGQVNQAEGSAGLLGGDQPIDDTILSLFADAGLGVEVDRLDVVTPGFMDNATSATVTLVQANADFPDAPEGTKQTDSDSAEKEPSVEEEPKAEGTKKAAPSKPRSLKSGGSTRAASLRAAAVRRRSIESEQAAATAAKPAPVAAPAPAKPVAPAKITSEAPASVKDKESAPTSQKIEKSAPPARKSSVTASKPAAANTKAGASASDTKNTAVEAKPASSKPQAVAATATHKPVAPTAPTQPPASDLSGRPKSSRGLGSAGGAVVAAETSAPQGAADGRPKSGALVPKAPANASGSSGARPGSKGVTRPVSQDKPMSPKAAPPMAVAPLAVAPKAVTPKAVPSAVQQKAIEETRLLVQNYVTNTLDLAVAGVLKNFALEQSRAQTAAGEGGDVVRDELSTVLKEGSRVTNKSMNASEVEASLDYSMDFERSV